MTNSLGGERVAWTADATRSLADELVGRGLPMRRAVHVARRVGAEIVASGGVRGALSIDDVVLVERGGDRYGVRLRPAGGVDVPAPEQLDGRIDARTDVWALGVLLHRMLTGCAPFRGAAQILAECPDVPGDLGYTISRCLATDPSDRFPDVPAVVAALAPFELRFPHGSLTMAPPIIDRTPRGTGPLVVVPPPAPTRRRTRWRLVAIAIGAVVGAIAGGLLI